MSQKHLSSSRPLKKFDDIANIPGALAVDFSKDYHYQKALTTRLDKQDWTFTEQRVLEIALWKLNRYLNVSEQLIQLLNGVKAKPTQANGEEALKFMLSDECFGIDLPMASTMLRFASPLHFQIIDQRVYRFITPGAAELNLRISQQAKIDLYFNYLQRLRDLRDRHGIPFENGDRIFYILDKRENKDHPLHLPHRP
jgi:hypothetical protein